MTCKLCNKEFEKDGRRKTYCSEECQREAKKLCSKLFHKNNPKTVIRSEIEKCDCFGYKKEDYCYILTSKECKDCKFYKTKKQYRDGLNKYPYDRNYASKHK